MKKIEHIGIAVKDITTANETYAKLLGGPHYKMEKVESESVETSFFQIGESKIELLQATNADSAIAKSIEKIYADAISERYIDLAFHYEQAEVLPKMREFLV